MRQFHLGLLATGAFLSGQVLACSSSPNQQAERLADRGGPATSALSMSSEGNALVSATRAMFRSPARYSLPRRNARPARAILAPGAESYVAVGGRLRIASGASKRANEITLGGRASDEITIRERSMAHPVGVTLIGSGPVDAKLGEGYAAYPRGYRDQADVFVKATSDGVEDFVLFRARPAESALSYRVNLGPSIAGVRVVANTVELLDDSGAPRVRMRAPWAIDAQGKTHALAVSVPDCAVDTSTKAPWGRAVVRPGREACTVRVSWGDAAYPLLVDPSWSSSGATASAHYGPGAAKLADGRVLVAGGYDATDLPTGAAEIYDPASKTWSSTGSLATGRAYPGAVRIAGGRVFVSGGEDATGSSLSSAEVFDPSGGTWSAAAAMAGTREGHNAEVLSDGRVFVFGGATLTPGTFSTLASAEIYDPSGNTWSAASTSSCARYFGSSVVMPNGRVFVAGGYTGTSTMACSETYDPTNDSWSTNASMATARELHTATLLADGRVFVVGGDSDTAVYGSTEYYDPSNDTWSAGPSMGNARANHVAARLSDGRIFVTGGYGATVDVATAEVLDAAGTAWSSAGDMTQARDGEVGVHLDDSRFLVAGGAMNSTYVTSSELSLTGDATANKSAYAAGEQIQVQFAGIPGTGADWLAIAPEGSSMGTFSQWAWQTAASGSYAFPSVGPGTYRVRMFYNNGYTLIGQSASTFTVAGASTSVTTDKGSYTTAEPIQVTWASLSGSSTDWVAISANGSPVTSFIRWTYTGGSVNGSTSFAAMSPGTYVARAYNNNSYVLAAESAAFTVTGASSTAVSNDKSSYTSAESVVVTYSAMLGSYTDWISIAPQGSPATDLARWVYTGGATSGTVTISLSGIAPGNYVTRAYFNNDYNLQAESAAFSLTP